MTLEDNKRLVQQYFEAFNTGNVEILDKILDARFHMRTLHEQSEDVAGRERGPAHSKEVARAWRISFPDGHIHIEEAIAEAAAVIVRWRMTGTHLVEFSGIPPTRK